MGDAIISRASKNGNVNIVQDTGTSATDVISQKGCTDSFATKKHEHSAEDIVSGIISVENGGTGAANADDARMNLEVPANKTINQQMTDFNDYTEVGFYSLYNPLYNVPDTSMSGNYSYSLVVAHGVFKNGTYDIDQIAVSENGDMYLRHHSRSFNTWYSWQRINNTNANPLEINRGGTNANSAEQARRNLNVPYRSIFAYGNYDVNNIVDTGFYILAHDCINVPPTNSSYTTWGLMVYPLNEANTNNFSVFQMCIPTSDPNQKSAVWIRQKYYYSSSYTWTEWKNITNDETSVEILQTTGTSETAVMSQNSCTNSFAAKSHNHSTSDLTSGVLSVSRGGTGASTAQQARKNLGLGKLATKNNIDFYDSEQYTGILGVQSGGTGASTAEQARKNLNVPYLPSSYYEGDLNNLTATGFYTINDRGTTNAPPTKQFSPSWLLMVMSSKETSLNVGTFQICSEIFATKQTSVWVRKCDGISSSNWTDWENINYNSDVNLVRSISEDINLYISPSGNDTTGDGSWSNPYATMNKALSLLSGKMINSLVTIYVMDGTYDESLDLIGLYGSGSVRILGYSLERGSFKSCRIDNNALRTLEIHETDIGSGTMYVRENSCYINLFGINFTGTSISLSTSNVMISRCNFSNTNTAISVYPSGGAGGMGYDGVGKVI